jgi:uncharacterized protein with HEPN domain
MCNTRHVNKEDTMYCVVRKGEGLDKCHASFHAQAPARNYAENLRASLGHHYDVVKVETVWTTATLHELMEEDRKTA